MRAVDLKRKYPEMWKAVESEVKFDCRKLTVNSGDVDRLAHNAAFVACSEHDKGRKRVSS